MAPKKDPPPKPAPAPKPDVLGEQVAKHSERLQALEADLEKLKRSIANALGITVD